MPDAAAVVIDEADREERAGGAGLAATLLARDGFNVTLVTAIAADEAGARLLELLQLEQLTVVNIGADEGTCEKQRVFANNQPVMRLDRGRSVPRRASRLASAAIEAADAVLVSDYGLGITSDLRLRQTLTDRAARGTPIVWDPHPRGAPPVVGVRAVTPNLREAGHFASGLQR